MEEMRVKEADLTGTLREMQDKIRELEHVSKGTLLSNDKH